MNESQQPARDRYLGETVDHLNGDDPDPLDELAEEFAERCRLGEAPSIAEYEARLPEQAERLRGLLSTVAMMEQLKRDAMAANEKVSDGPPPERLGEFRILRELGRGGMGVVYEAVQETLGRHVALKVVHHIHLDARRLERFRREARAVAQLHHTNIVPIFAVGEHDGLPYYAMQYIRGSGLDLLLSRWREDRSAQPQDRARFVVSLGQQAAGALQYAHEQGILHRDIKPANLLVDENRAVWVTDFGLAKLVGHEELTASGDVIGTLRYLAPEALQGVSGPRGDIYSLGLTLYELLTLVPPFGDVNPSALLHQVNEGQIVRPRRLDPTIPRDLETIVLKAIAREPDHRYETAGALAEDLRRFLEDRPIQARRATTFERAVRWGRRNRLAAALIATAAAALLLAAIVGWVGYASTKKALEGESIRRHEAEAATRRADENVALSLEVFAELFDKLSPRGDPFPPPTGRAQPPRTAEIGRRLEPPDGQPGRRPDPPPLLGASNPFAKDAPRDGETGGLPRRLGTQGNHTLFQSVLGFYDRFAQRNEAEPRLQGEAAWAYFKVGILYEQLGRDREAEDAISRAIALLEDLIARFPKVAIYRSRLVEIVIMAEPWSADPGSLEGLEGRLLRARTVIDELAAESPRNADYHEAQVHVHAKLGVVLQRRHRPDEAEASYRRALAITGTLLEQSPRDDRARIDRADIHEDLAVLKLDRGSRGEAKALLDEADRDLRSLVTDIAKSRIVADRYAILAEDFQRLGETTRANDMARRAEEINALPRSQGRGPGSPR